MLDMFLNDLYASQEFDCMYETVYNQYCFDLMRQADSTYQEPLPF